MKQLNARVLSNDRIFGSPDASYFILRVKAPEIAADSKPGQFCMLKCGPDALLRRPISIHSVTRNGEIDFFYVRGETVPTYIGTGKGKDWLSRIAPGSQLDIIGPLGNGFSFDDKANNVLLAAGGVGIAPLLFLAQKAVASGKNVTLLQGTRCRQDLYREDLLPPGIQKVMTVESPANSGGLPLGKVTDLLPAYAGSADQVFACGPQAMLEAISSQLDNKVIARPVQVSLEVRMGCGSGACFGCSIRTKRGMQRVCKEGPVFNIKDIIWQEVKI